MIVNWVKITIQISVRDIWAEMKKIKLKSSVCSKYSEYDFVFLIIVRVLRILFMPLFYFLGPWLLPFCPIYRVPVQISANLKMRNTLHQLGAWANLPA